MEAWMLPLSCKRNTWKSRWDNHGKRKKISRQRPATRVIVIQLFFFVKKKRNTKQPKTQKQPEHQTDLLNHRHKGIMKYYKLKTKPKKKTTLQETSCCPRPLDSGAAGCPALSQWNCCAARSTNVGNTQHLLEKRIKTIRYFYPFQINKSVIYSNI